MILPTEFADPASSSPDCHQRLFLRAHCSAVATRLTAQPLPVLVFGHTQEGKLGCGCLLSPFLWTSISCGCISSQGQLSAPILSFQGFHSVTRVTKSLPCLLSPSVCWVSSLTCPLMVTMQLPQARKPHSWAVSVCS